MKRPIRSLTFIAVLGFIGIAWMFPALPIRAAEPGFAAVKAKAEKLYQEGAYGAARKAYQVLDLKTLTKDQARWVEFRLADTLWRTASIEYPDDYSQLEWARAKLEALAARTLRVTDRDETWADIQLSLGDFWWTRRNWSNWEKAGPYYEKALEWWAGRPKGEEAADHYLGILWSMAAPTEDDWSTWRSHPGDEISRDALENALRIATTTEQKIHLHYLLARNLVLKRKTVRPGEVQAQFEAVLQAGKTSKYYDDALYQYACWFEKSHKIQEEDGIIDSPPDYSRTLALYRRYLKEFKKGEGAHWKAVKS
ncbi:MAG: hypothetical protein P8018_10055, partial [Acidobacteriota bacterium]